MARKVGLTVEDRSPDFPAMEGDQQFNGETGELAESAEAAENDASHDNDQANEEVTESKSDRFRRLVSVRASNALDAMRLITRLADHKNYDFESEQVDKVLGTLQASLDEIKKCFASELEKKSTPVVPGMKRKKGNRALSFRL